MDHLEDPQAISWDDMQDELGLTGAERARIDASAAELIAQARAHVGGRATVETYGHPPRTPK